MVNDPDGSLDWYGWSLLGDIAKDGQSVLFIEAGATGNDWGEYIRKMDGSPAVRIGDGAFGRFSPDGNWVATFGREPGSLVAIPVGAGAPRVISIPKVDNLSLFSWLPDGRLVFTGAEPGHKSRTYAVPMNGGPAVPITPEGVVGWLATPDGKYLLSRSRGWELYPVAGGQPVKLTIPEQCCWKPVGWHSDGRLRIGNQPIKDGNHELVWKIKLLDLSTGKMDDWKEVKFAGDASGVEAFYPPLFSADGSAYAYSYKRVLTQLYLVEGLQ